MCRRTIAARHGGLLQGKCRFLIILLLLLNKLIAPYETALDLWITVDARLNARLLIILLSIHISIL